MRKPIQVTESHECNVLQQYNSRSIEHEIAIQKLNGLWYWVNWSDKYGNTAYGIVYCPYCGKKLDQ